MAVVITPLSDTPTAPHQSTNGSFYKDRDVRPPVHIAPDLADYPPVSHLFHVQPLEAFLSPCTLSATALFVPSIVRSHPRSSFKPYQLPPASQLRTYSPKLVVRNLTGLCLVKWFIPAPPLLTSNPRPYSTVEYLHCGLRFNTPSATLEFMQLSSWYAGFPPLQSPSQTLPGSRVAAATNYHMPH